MKELRGMPVVNAITEKVKKDITLLKEKGILPKLAVVRIGAREDDISYEKGILKRFAAAGAEVGVIALPAETPQDEVDDTVSSLNDDKKVHGILIFRPLPKPLSQEKLRDIIAAEKDVDCMGTINAARLYEGSRDGYAPCTAEAVMETLDFYGIELKGKRAVVIGRSLVVGKPLAMLLLGRDATVTVCHSKTANLADECRRADVLIACVGSARMVDASFTHPGQIVIDVGINMVGDKLAGDVDYEAVADKVEAITPVPGGIGTVTTSVLLMNTVRSAMRMFV